jgi:hypothetical protein
MQTMDHSKTWRYRVNASPHACLAKFAEAFNTGGRPLWKIDWSLRGTDTGAVAVYKERRGLAKATTIVSSRARRIEQRAAGSQVRFDIEEVGGDYTVCVMRLYGRGPRLGVTADAGLIRPYMHAVERAMLQIDPSAQITSS